MLQVCPQLSSVLCLSYGLDCVTFSGDQEGIRVPPCTHRLTFCHNMMRMMREMTVRTTKARMAEITTTLKGKAEDRDQSRP